MTPTVQHRILGRNLASAFLLALLMFHSRARAQLELAPGPPQNVFAGPRHAVSTTWHNSSNKLLSLEVAAHFAQASSTTVAPLPLQSQKHLELQPGQTLSDFAVVDFPMVRAVTRFLIIWSQGTNRVVGISQIDVYPPDLLKELRTLAAGQPMAVYDPQNELKPLLPNLSLDFEDIERIGWERCQAALALVFSNSTSNSDEESIARGIDMLIRNRAAVVWIRSDLNPGEDTWSSYVGAEQRKAALITVPRSTVEELAQRPQAQLNLIELARDAFRLRNILRQNSPILCDR